ncbi:hypothetical protein LZ659_08535 [Shewanella indica]|uniref:Lipoprotein n=2 Tax=Shewanella TaxID=22 RepID=A0ABU4Q8P9_9GAMM|nr:hypothetical protein [Shewanella indica]MCE9791641.1 hypothetical protein [Shewanella indica]MDX6014978.1 hypothetical protein [Shewanella indica]
MNRRFIFSACLLTLASCATTPSADIQAKRAQLEATTPVCIDEKDCKAKWEAAQLWIVRNAGFKLQIVTDVLLQTYNATGGSPSLAVQATKEPIGGGKYKILVSISCDNVFGCVPNQWDAALSFNRTVSAVTP